MHCAVCGVLSAVSSVQCSLFSVQCEVYSMQCAVCIVVPPHIKGITWRPIKVDWAQIEGAPIRYAMIMYKNLVGLKSCC